MSQTPVPPEIITKYRPYLKPTDSMKIPSWREARPAVLMVGALATAAGIIPEGVSTAIVDSAELAFAGLMGLWGATAFLRNRKEK